MHIITVTRNSDPFTENAGRKGGYRELHHEVGAWQDRRCTRWHECSAFAPRIGGLARVRGRLPSPCDMYAFLNITLPISYSLSCAYTQIRARPRQQYAALRQSEVYIYIYIHVTHPQVVSHERVCAKNWRPRVRARPPPPLPL